MAQGSFLKIQYIWSALWSPKCSRPHRLFQKPHFGTIYCNTILSQHRGPLSGPFSTRFLFYGVMGWSTEESWFDFQQRQEAYTVSTATRGQGGLGVGPTTHFRLVPTLRLSGAIPPVPHIPSWRVRRQPFLHFSFRALQFNYCNVNNKRLIMKLMQLMRLFDTVILVPADMPIRPETCTS